MKKNMVVKSTFGALLALISTVTLSQVPADSPYNTDARYTYNKDETAEALEIISVVSCYVRGMAPNLAYAEGKTDYVAMVDENACESDKKTADSSGSTASTKNYATGVVQGSIDGDGALVANIWMSGKNDDGTDNKTWVKARIVAGAVKKPPFGEWEVNWCDDYANGVCSSLGHAKVDSSGVRAFNSGSEEWGSYERAVVGEVSTDAMSGGGRFVRKDERADGQFVRDIRGFYQFAPGLLFSKRTNVGSNTSESEQCLIPDSSKPGTLVSSWESWLYDVNTGQRIQRNSGFGIRDGNGDWGWAGIWGVSFGSEVPQNNATVTRVDTNGNVVANYTVVRAPGKLRKIDISSSSIGDIDGIRLRGSAPKRLVTGQANDSGWVGISFNWDSDAAKFVIHSYQSCNNSGCAEVAVTRELSLDELTDPNGLNQNALHGWVEGTNTNFNITLASWKETNGSWSRARYTNPEDVKVTSRSETVVAPGDTTVPSEFYCLGNCVDSSLDASWQGDVAEDSVITYSWDAGLGSMKLGSTPIDFTAEDNSYWSGSLVPSDQATRVACRVGGTNGYCESQVEENLTTYYRWESGPSPWNVYTGLKDADGQPVIFEPPMNVSYDVPDSDPSRFAGKTVTFQYPGNGSLWIPGYCYEPTTRARADCNVRETEWANEFSIPYDPVAGVVTEAETQRRYLVKTLRRGVMFPLADTGACTQLKTTASTYENRTLPTLLDWRNPADPTSSDYIGEWRDPAEGQAPLIIDGELQR